MADRKARFATGGVAASRREFFGGALLLAGSAVMPVHAAPLRAAAFLRAGTAVVAFHADQLYFDHSGTTEPYRPPSGLRSLDGLDEEALSHLVYNL